MPSLDLQLRITAEEYRKRYLAPGATIHARATDGRSVALPAGALQRFVTHEGVYGLFRVEFGEDGRLRSVARL